MPNFAICSIPEPITLINKVSLSLDELPLPLLEAARLLQQGLENDAITTIKDARPATPELPWGWIISVTAFCRLGDFKTASEVAKRGLQVIGNNTYLLDCMGVASFVLKDFVNAENSFLQAIQTDAHNINAIVNLANVFISQNLPDKAFETLQQGLKQNPFSPEIKPLYTSLHPNWAQPLRGGKLRLRMLCSTDEDFLARCFSNREFMNNYHRFAAINQTRQHIQDTLKQNTRYSILRQKKLHWLIEETNHPVHEQSNYQPIGLASLVDIQLNYQRAEMLIGFPDPVHRGQGIPLTAILLILDFAFNHIGFNKLISIVYGDNQYSERSTLALGSTQEGFRPDHLRDLQTGEFLSIYENGLLQRDFRTNARLSRLSARLLGFDITCSKSG